MHVRISSVCLKAIRLHQAFAVRIFVVVGLMLVLCMIWISQFSIRIELNVHTLQIHFRWTTRTHSRWILTWTEKTIHIVPPIQNSMPFIVMVVHGCRSTQFTGIRKIESYQAPTTATTSNKNQHSRKTSTMENLPFFPYFGQRKISIIHENESLKKSIPKPYKANNK